MVRRLLPARAVVMVLCLRRCRRHPLADRLGWWTLTSSRGETVRRKWKVESALLFLSAAYATFLGLKENYLLLLCHVHFVPLGNHFISAAKNGTRTRAVGLTN